MNDTMVKTYQNRIVNATRKELLVITYEMLITTIDEAVQAIDISDEKTFDKVMHRAHGFLKELSNSLDVNYEISKNLMSIYIYVNKRMIEASMHVDRTILLEIKEILNILLVGWQQSEASEHDGAPMVQNSQKVYAGLTYGKGMLNETVYDGCVERGLKA